MKEEELDSNDYYDAVADEYDNILLADDSNKIVRKKISQYVLGIQGINTIMDFGGGTGLDLTWMAEQFDVVFCEPSRKMRTKAEALVETSLTDARINILNDQDSNYLHWNDDLLNKIARPEAVLANFAVLNSISDLETMFEKMAWLLLDRSHFICTILRPRRWAFQKATVIEAGFENNRMQVFVHSKKEIVRTAKPHFNPQTSFRIGKFNVLHFVKNGSRYPKKTV